MYTLVTIQSGLTIWKNGALRRTFWHHIFTGCKAGRRGQVLMRTDTGKSFTKTHFRATFIGSSGSKVVSGRWKLEGTMASVLQAQIPSCDALLCVAGWTDLPRWNPYGGRNRGSLRKDRSHSSPDSRGIGISSQGWASSRTRRSQRPGG